MAAYIVTFSVMISRNMKTSLYFIPCLPFFSITMLKKLNHLNVLLHFFTHFILSTVFKYKLLYVIVVTREFQNSEEATKTQQVFYGGQDFNIHMCSYILWQHPWLSGSSREGETCVTRRVKYCMVYLTTNQNTYWNDLESHRMSCDKVLLKAILALISFNAISVLLLNAIQAQDTM
jgi:hypothetical protein